MLEESIISKLESLRLRSTEIHEALANEGATDDMVQFTKLNNCLLYTSPSPRD